MQLETLVAEPWPDWGLIDSGDGRKLERYGKIKVIRPEPQAMWAAATADWDADATFVPGSDEEGGGRWIDRPELGEKVGQGTKAPVHLDRTRQLVGAALRRFKRHQDTGFHLRLRAAHFDVREGLARVG